MIVALVVITVIMIAIIVGLIVVLVIIALDWHCVVVVIVVVIVMTFHSYQCSSCSSINYIAQSFAVSFMLMLLCYGCRFVLYLSIFGGTLQHTENKYVVMWWNVMSSMYDMIQYKSIQHWMI